MTGGIFKLTRRNEYTHETTHTQENNTLRTFFLGGVHASL